LKWCPCSEQKTIFRSVYRDRMRYEYNLSFLHCLRPSLLSGIGRVTNRIAASLTSSACQLSHSLKTASWSRLVSQTSLSYVTVPSMRCVMPWCRSLADSSLPLNPGSALIRIPGPRVHSSITVRVCVHVCNKQDMYVFTYCPTLAGKKAVLHPLDA